MTLVDTDKSSDDRSSPMPDAHDVHPNPMSKQTNSTTYAVNQTKQGRIAMLNNQINAYDPSGVLVSTYGIQADGSINLKFFDTNGVGVAEFGRFSDGTTALKVARSGQEVSTATNDLLIFNSNQDIFKIVGTLGGSPQFPAVSGNWTAPNFSQKSATNSYPHGLSFIPTCITIMVDAAGYTSAPFAETGMGDANNTTLFYIFYKVNVDATNVNLKTVALAGGSASSGSFSTSARSAKVYLLQETAN